MPYTPVDIIGTGTRKGESMAEITIRISDKVLRIATIGIVGTIAACLLLYLWSSGILTPGYRLSVYVPEVGGLTVGSPVLLDTVSVGKVDAVKLAEASANAQRRIELVLRIEKRFQNDVRNDSTAKITTQGLLGGPVVSIQRGFGGTPIKPGEEIPFIQMPEATAKDFLTVLTRLADCQKQSKQAGEAISR
jgi:phospholipid/cholesterol/gamma-HCH transport system substrate-binding protein